MFVFSVAELDVAVFLTVPVYPVVAFPAVLVSPFLQLHRKIHTVLHNRSGLPEKAKAISSKICLAAKFFT